MSGELDFIRWLRTQHRPSDRVTVPVGDDLAVLHWAADDLLLVGIDQVLDGVHFDSAIHGPRLIGRKAMNRNLSDCAAMACLPAAAVASVALPHGAGIAYAKEIYLGLRDAGDPFDCAIVGGDTASWPGRLAVTLSILGRSAGIAPLTRAGARPGNGLYASGPLGGSILGRHMTFAPRVALARELARGGAVTAMIDLSDGLSRDLGHLCHESDVGAIVEAACVPIHDDAREQSRRDGRAPLDHALHDGEDHELLIAATRDLPGTVRIGAFTSEPGIWLVSEGRRQKLEPGGWEHLLDSMSDGVAAGPASARHPAAPPAAEPTGRDQ